jgi:hypothetical protein
VVSNVDEASLPELTTGARLSSTVCTTQIVVLRAGPAGRGLECGGAPMTSGDVPPPPDARPGPGLGGGSQLGKRYRTLDATVEVLCVKAGLGTLSIAGSPLEVSTAARLPASD